MDSILDVIISLLIIIGFSVLGTRKKKKGYQEVPEHSYEEIFESEETLSNESFLQEKSVNISNKRQFQQKNDKNYRIEFSPSEGLQDIDNEEVNNNDFSFSAEEMRQGIIYHEILKRPNY